MAKRLSHIKNYIIDNTILLLLIATFILNDILVRFLCSLSTIDLSYLFFYFFHYTCIFLILSIFNKKSKVIFSIVLAFANTIYSFAQAMHYSFFNCFFSIKKLTIASELKGVSDEIFTKFTIKYLCFLVPFLAFVICVKLLNKKIRINGLSFNKIATIIVLLSFLVVCKHIYVQKYALETDELTVDVLSDSFLYNHITSNTSFYEKFGCFEYVVNDVKRLQNKSSITSEELGIISDFISSTKKENSKHAGEYKGKNLILILCESLGPQAINKELTPTLYMMSTKGTYFTNFYSPLYPSNTNDAEFIVQTGQIPSIDYGTTSKDFGQNYYPYSLANLFKANGYSANSFHSHEKEFYNREQFHSSLGFEYLYDDSDLGISVDGINYSHWIDDSVLFEKALEYTNFESTFFDFIITTSGHIPYSSERIEIQENYQKVKSIYPNIPEQEAYYYAAQMKLDQGLKTLINSLERDGILEETIIIIFGDHYPYGIGDGATLDDFYGDLENDYDIYKTPFIIYDSSKNGQEISYTTSTFDIYPTIASLFGLDESKAYTVGEDAFIDDDNRLVLFQDHSVLSKEFFYDSNAGLIIGEDKNNLLSTANKHYKYSQEILACDYYSQVK